jgi:hypothetical protein
MLVDSEKVPSTLLDKVVSILEAKRDKEYMVIWRETGIPYFWIRKIANREIENPGVKRVQFLYEYLTGKKLEV